MELAGGQAFDQADGILQEEGDADGGDQRHQARRVAQRPVCYPLDHHRRGARRGHACHDGKDQPAVRCKHRGPRQQTAGVQSDQDFNAHKSANGKNFTVSEIDKFQYAVDHGVAQGDGGINKPKHHAID